MSGTNKGNQKCTDAGSGGSLRTALRRALSRICAIFWYQRPEGQLVKKGIAANS